MIVTVTPNPALDITYTVSRLSPGSSHRVEAGIARAGGKGLNVARVLHSMGHDVVALAPIGGATGDAFRAELAASGLSSDLVHSDVETRRSVAIVDELTGEATVLNERGVAPGSEVLDALIESVAAAVASASVVVLSGSLAPGTPGDLIDRIVGCAHAAGAAVVVDTSGPAMMRAAARGADLLTPNHDEATEATGAADPVVAARRLVAAGAGAAAVSLGADGMILVRRADPTTVWRAYLPERLHGNPTGAGDAACAAFAVGFAEDAGDIERTLTRAVAWSAAAVLSPLAGEVAPVHNELAGRVEVRREYVSAEAASAPTSASPARPSSEHEDVS